MPVSTLAPDDAASPGWNFRPSRRSIIRAVGRRLVPYLIEATLVPSALFYVLLLTAGLHWGLLGALSWSYAALARRILTARRVPCVLMLGAFGITLKTVVYLLRTDSFLYFLQPILRGTLTAGLFAGSVIIGRPLIARFASDFCPLSDEVNDRPGICLLFRRLTYLWAGLNLVGAAASLVLLLTLPVAVFVATATASTWLITTTGIVVTVFASTHVAHAEGLVTAVGPTGTLHAYVTAR